MSIIVLQNRHRALQNDDSMIELLVHKVDGTTRHLHPVFEGLMLRIESRAGLGAGKPVAKQIEEFTDLYSFLFWQIGVRN